MFCFVHSLLVMVCQKCGTVVIGGSTWCKYWVFVHCTCTGEVCADYFCIVERVEGLVSLEMVGCRVLGVFYSMSCYCFVLLERERSQRKLLKLAWLVFFDWKKKLVLVLFAEVRQVRDCSVQCRCLYWVNRLLAGADSDLWVYVWDLGDGWRWSNVILIEEMLLLFVSWTSSCKVLCWR